MTEITNEVSLGKQSSISLKRVGIIGGAFVGLLIGSGFATGQEIMQYFVSYGYGGILGAFGVLALLVFVGTSFIAVGNAERFEKGAEIFSYYAGPKVGRFYDIFSNLFVFMTYIIMIAGAASTGTQQYGWPGWVGGAIMIALTIGTVLMGLDNFVNIIGSIMPIVVGLSFFLSISTLITHGTHIAANVAMLPGMIADGTIMQASNSWWTAAFSYVGFSMMLLAAFLAETGKSAGSQKEARAGASLGAVAFCASVIILTLGLTSAAHLVGGADIPSLILADNIHPVFGQIYALIMFTGIYSTAVPLLWNPCARFSKEGTPKFRGLVAALGIAGGVVGLFVEFPALINFIYGINGYVGILFLVFMIVHFVRYKGFLKPGSKAKLADQ